VRRRGGRPERQRRGQHGTGAGRVPQVTSLLTGDVCGFPTKAGEDCTDAQGIRVLYFGQVAAKSSPF
jgi:hypothetical protein